MDNKVQETENDTYTDREVSIMYGVLPAPDSDYTIEDLCPDLDSDESCLALSEDNSLACYINGCDACPVYDMGGQS